VRWVRLAAALTIVTTVAAACERQPVELGFWMEPQSYRSSRIGEPMTAEEYRLIDDVARREIARAFRDFDVRVTASPAARYTIRVRPRVQLDPILKGGDVAGASRGIGGLGGTGAVSFEYVANSAMALSPASATRPEIIETVGRGIGRVAIHEFLHQLLPNSPLHDSRDPHSYEGSNPTRVDGFFGELRWGIARPWLNDRLKRR